MVPKRAKHHKYRLRSTGKLNLIMLIKFRNFSPNTVTVLERGATCDI